MAFSVTEVDEIELLILKFYDPKAHAERPQIDKALIDLQKGPLGFQLADALLKSSHDEVRFFGATTFIVKINNDLRALDDNSKEELLDRLITWLLTATNEDFRSRTVRKMCAAIVAYFISTEGRWSNCIVHVLASLLQGTPTNISRIEDVGVDLNTAIVHLNPRQLITIFAFISTLVEETGKMSSTSSKVQAYNKAIIANAPIIVFIIGYGLDNSGRIDTVCSEDAIKCYSSVVLWSKDAVGEQSKTLDTLRPPFVTLLTMLFAEEDKGRELFGEVNDTVYSILTNFDRFLNEEYYGILASALLSSKATEWFNRILEGDFEDEPWAIGRLLLAFGEARLEDIVTRPEAPITQEVMSRLYQLAKCKGVVIVDDEISTETVEFWISLIERLGDDQFESNGEIGPEYWLAWQNGLLLKIVDAFFEKHRLPESGVFQMWSDDSKQRFHAFRRQVQNIFTGTLDLFGMALVNHLVGYLWAFKRRSDWRGVEVSLYAINSLDGSGEDLENRMINVVVSAENSNEVTLFEHLSHEGEGLSMATRRQAIGFVNTYAAMLSRNPSCIPNILQFLSICLKIPLCADFSAGSISELCFVARTTMIPILADLYSLYNSYASSTNRTPVVQARLTGAVAAVIQASTLPSPTTDDRRCSEAIFMLGSMMDLIQEDVISSLDPAPQDPEKLHGLALCALNCLKNMGKALRVPDDEVVDLDGDASPRPKSIWEERPEITAQLQNRVLGLCTQVLGRYSDEEVIEQVCSILRAGYTETVPGPFVFPLSATESFVRQCHLSTPRIGLVLEMASVLLTKHRSSPSHLVKEYALGCLKHIRSMLVGFFRGNPSEDPEVASLVVDFFRGYIPKYTSCLLNGDESDNLRATFDFALACIESDEIMPKRSAAAFWLAFITESNQSSSVPGIEECLTQYGKRFTTALIGQVGGGASRSQLDDLCGPLKAIVYKGGPFQSFINDALLSLPVQNDRISLAQKRVFAEQILRLRGGTQTNKIVKEFWAACRGTFSMS